MHAGVSEGAPCQNLIPTTNPHEIRAWAERHNAVPVEMLPHRVDSEPALLALMSRQQAEAREDVRILPWPEFFLKFAALGLTFVYDPGPSGRCELLQQEGNSPYSPPAYRKRPDSN